jgi:hypothetical protein
VQFRIWLEAVERSRTFYRGFNPGDTRRIKTGFGLWDSFLFVADNPKSASAYGHTIEVWQAKPSAHIVYEGSKEFRSLAKGLSTGNKSRPSKMTWGQWCEEIAKRAVAAGNIDALWFQRQTDIGTAIINRDQFERVGLLDNDAGLVQSTE